MNLWTVPAFVTFVVGAVLGWLIGYAMGMADTEQRYKP